MSNPSFEITGFSFTVNGFDKPKRYYYNPRTGHIEQPDSGQKSSLGEMTFVVEIAEKLRDMADKLSESES